MIADRYDAFLFDLDGVLYRGPDPVPGAAAVLARLRELGKGIAFVTNNSARTPADVVRHLAMVGIVASVEEVETSALTTGLVLAGRRVRTAYVIGEEGLRSALAGHGIETVDGQPATVDVVVVGFDRHATYETLRTASILVERGAALVASNADASFPRRGRARVAGGRGLARGDRDHHRCSRRGRRQADTPPSSKRRSPGPAVAAPSWSATGSTPTSWVPTISDGTRCSC